MTMSDINGTPDSYRDGGTPDGGTSQSGPSFAFIHGSPGQQYGIRESLNQEGAAGNDVFRKVAGESGEALALEEEAATGSAVEIAPIAPYLPLLALSGDDRIFCRDENGKHWWEAVNP